MTIANAIKKLNAAGFTVAQMSEGSIFMVAENSTKREVISFIVQGDKIACIKTAGKGDQSDAQRDYFAGTYSDNLTQAIKNCR